jgi:hypothetical protein
MSTDISLASITSHATVAISPKPTTCSAESRTRSGKSAPGRAMSNPSSGKIHQEAFSIWRTMEEPIPARVAAITRLRSRKIRNRVINESTMVPTSTAQEKSRTFQCVSRKSTLRRAPTPRFCRGSTMVHLFSTRKGDSKRPPGQNCCCLDSQLRSNSQIFPGYLHALTDLRTAHPLVCRQALPYAASTSSCHFSMHDGR